MGLQRPHHLVSRAEGKEAECGATERDTSLQGGAGTAVGGRGADPKSEGFLRLVFLSCFEAHPCASPPDLCPVCRLPCPDRGVASVRDGASPDIDLKVLKLLGGHRDARWGHGSGFVIWAGFVIWVEKESG